MHTGFQGAVLDGRDVGTVLCPDAPVKLFVIASAEVSPAEQVLLHSMARKGERSRQAV